MKLSKVVVKVLAAATCVLTACTGPQPGAPSSRDASLGTAADTAASSVTDGTASESTYEAEGSESAMTTATGRTAKTAGPTSAGTTAAGRPPVMTFGSQGGPTSVSFDPTKEKQTYSYTDEERIAPFWKGNTMRNECVVFVRTGDTARGSLLFQPYKILSVRDWTLDKEYREGTDWTWDGTSRTLHLPAGSAIPYFTENQLAGNEGHNNDCGATGKLGGGLYCVGEYLYGRQISVTYIYDSAAFDGPVPSYQGDGLPKTTAKLKAGGKVNVAVFGDSIMEGCDASSMYRRKPRLPMMADLLKSGLEKRYGASVTVHNASVGGKTSQWGVEEAARVTAGGFKPDLVLLAFGQNDSQMTPETTRDNHQAIINKVKAVCPDAEFLVLSTINANAKAGFQHQQVRQAQLLAGLKKTGVAVVDINGLHIWMLGRKEHYVDLSGNNINHPNDFFIRVYVMCMMAALAA